MAVEASAWRLSRSRSSSSDKRSVEPRRLLIISMLASANRGPLQQVRTLLILGDLSFGLNGPGESENRLCRKPCRTTGTAQRKLFPHLNMCFPPARFVAQLRKCNLETSQFIVVTAQRQ